MTKQIPVGPDHYAVVDDEDYELLSQHKWNALSRDRSTHARRETRWKGLEEEPQYMHQLLLPDVDQVDHVNGNGLDNRRENLRPATNSQNKANQTKMRGHYTSTFKGVCSPRRFRNFAKPWVTQVMLNRQRLYYETFATELEAARAYDRKAIELFGEYACTNFPKEEYL